MIEVLQFLFATARDQNLYFNQESLVKELLVEQKFTSREVQEAMDWFAPIVTSKWLEINPQATRSLASWEEKRLPRVILKQILELEKDKKIDLTERELLLDRLGELGLDWDVDPEDMQIIFDGLIYHLKSYKGQATIACYTKSPYFVLGNATIN